MVPLTPQLGQGAGDSFPSPLQRGTEPPSSFSLSLLLTLGSQPLSCLHPCLPPATTSSPNLPDSRTSLGIGVIQGIPLLEDPHGPLSPSLGPEGPTGSGATHFCSWDACTAGPETHFLQQSCRCRVRGSLGLCQEKGGFQVPLQTKGPVGN